MMRRRTIVVGEINCPIEETFCLLCGDGPFTEKILALHFEQCYEEHCPTPTNGRKNSNVSGSNSNFNHRQLNCGSKHNLFNTMPQIPSH